MKELCQSEIEQLSPNEKLIYYTFHGDKGKLEREVTSGDENLKKSLLALIDLMDREDVKTELLIKAIFYYDESANSSPYLIENILDNHTNLTIQGIYGETPLVTCAFLRNQQKSCQIAELLVKRGVDLHQRGLIPVANDDGAFYFKSASLLNAIKYVLSAATHELKPILENLQYLKNDILKQINDLMKLSDLVTTLPVRDLPYNTATSRRENYLRFLNRMKVCAKEYPETHDRTIIESLQNFGENLTKIKYELMRGEKYRTVDHLFKDLRVLRAILKNKEHFQYSKYDNSIIAREATVPARCNNTFTISV